MLPGHARRQSNPARAPFDTLPSAARTSLAPLLGAALPGVPGREERQEKYGADTPKADLFHPIPPSEPLRDTAIVAPRRAFPVLSAPRRASPVVAAPQRSSPKALCGRGAAAIFPCATGDATSIPCICCSVESFPRIIGAAARFPGGRSGAAIIPEHPL